MSCCSFKKRTFQKVNNLEEIKLEADPILKNKKKRIKRSSIYPAPNKGKEKEYNKFVIEEKNKQREAFTKKFIKEIIACGACKEQFRIGDHALKINCGSCNQFFHCSIAGSCIGPNCAVVLNGKKESLKYCNKCVNPKLRINNLDNDECLCRGCESDPSIDKYFLKI